MFVLREKDELEGTYFHLFWELNIWRVLDERWEILHILYIETSVAHIYYRIIRSKYVILNSDNVQNRLT